MAIGQLADWTHYQRDRCYSGEVQDALIALAAAFSDPTVVSFKATTPRGFTLAVERIVPVPGVSGG